jgi:hypothetical protein
MRLAKCRHTADTANVVLGHSLVGEETVTHGLIPVELRWRLVRLHVGRIELGSAGEFEVAVISSATNQRSQPEKSEHFLQDQKCVRSNTRDRFMKKIKLPLYINDTGTPSDLTNVWEQSTNVFHKHTSNPTTAPLPHLFFEQVLWLIYFEAILISFFGPI